MAQSIHAIVIRCCCTCCRDPLLLRAAFGRHPLPLYLGHDLLLLTRCPWFIVVTHVAVAVAVSSYFLFSSCKWWMTMNFQLLLKQGALLRRCTHVREISPPPSMCLLHILAPGVAAVARFDLFGLAVLSSCAQTNDPIMTVKRFSPFSRNNNYFLYRSIDTHVKMYMYVKYIFRTSKFVLVFFFLIDFARSIYLYAHMYMIIK